MNEALAARAGTRSERRRQHMADRRPLDVDDVVVSKIQDGHVLWIITADPRDRLSLRDRGHDWNVQYAVARGARLASSKGGKLWYTCDGTATLEYLATFPAIAA
jgi:hypothetical protein